MVEGAIYTQPQSTDLIINSPIIRTIKNSLQKKYRTTSPPVPQKSNNFRSYYPTRFLGMIEFHLIIRLRTVTVRFIDRRLKTTYNDNEELRNSFRSLTALSLVPLNHMIPSFPGRSTCVVHDRLAIIYDRL
ncbi:unnamed protein product, partial [Rotaria magnacalcarata]